MSSDLYTSSAGLGGGCQFRVGFEPRPAHKPWNINVLLVDDDAADISLILNVLRRHQNVSTAHALDDPTSALSELSAGRLRPDLILLDIHMPKMSGFEFLENLRRIRAMASVPAVFLTSSGLIEEVVGARRSSASFYLVKPHSYVELQARLDAVIKRAVSGAWSK